MRRQIELDKRTSQILAKLASCHGGNQSKVVCGAIQLCADMVDRLDEIEANPVFQKMMDDSAKAIREGRVTPHSQVVRMSRKLSHKGRSRIEKT